MKSVWVLDERCEAKKGKVLSLVAELCVASHRCKWRTEEDSNPRPLDS